MLLILILILLFVGFINGQIELTASDGVPNDNFGYSVSISNDYAIIGAFYKDSEQGAAYIYSTLTNDWLQQSILIAFDGAVGDAFGWSVSISNDYAIVGAYGKNSYEGSAYIYYRNSNNNWLQQSILRASDGIGGDQFGSSVSISNDYAIVGSYGKNSYKGAAYIYHCNSTNNNWLQQSILTASDGVANDFFGNSVSVSNNSAIVGAYGKNSNKGSAYIYHNCNPGSSMNGMNCTACLPGTYHPNEFSLSCSMCPAGSYCPDSNSTSPTTCSIGTYSNETGRSIDCPLCPSGSYCESPTSKTTCPAGSYCPESSTSPTTCSIGTYSLEKGLSTDCPLCPSGSYCETPTSKIICPAASYCANGSNNPNTPCPAGYYCLAGTTTPTPCQDGYYCVASSKSETPCSTSCPSNTPYSITMYMKKI